MAVWASCLRSHVSPGGPTGLTWLLPCRPPCPLPQIYLSYHPDLHKLGVTTEDAAKQHYLDKGRAEGRLYKRVRVMLRYTACTGLINQHYSHIAAFSLAAVLGAEIVLPPAVCRDSFAHYFRCRGRVPRGAPPGCGCLPGPATGWAEQQVLLTVLARQGRAADVGGQMGWQPGGPAGCTAVVDARTS